MYPGHASLLLLVGFAFGAATLISLVAVGHVLAARRLGLSPPLVIRRTLLFVVAACGWQLLVSAAAWTGVLSRFDAKPPPLLLMMVGVMVGAVWLARSSIGQTLQAGLPLAVLVAFQGFRLPLELLMHEAAAQGVMPPQMTYTGLNFDIVTGATAFVAAGLIATGIGGTRVAWAWNLLGSALLLAIIGIALASTPLVGAFGDGPALNTFVAYVPFTTLPTVMVLLALAGHFLVWLRLLRKDPT